MSAGPISGPEAWPFEALLAAGWTPEDIEWERAAEGGLAALAQHPPEGARARFGEAVRIATAAFRPDDPRLGTSLANHAAAMLSAGEGALAGRTIADARRIWRDCDAWIATLTPPRGARSSLYHLRIEQRHRVTYEARRRSEWAALVAEARAALAGVGPLAFVSAAEAGERLSRWRRERPAGLGDARKLMAAVTLLACRHES
jgi:hypothetical protein